MYKIVRLLKLKKQHSKEIQKNEEKKPLKVTAQIVEKTENGDKIYRKYLGENVKISVTTLIGADDFR